MNCLGEFNGDLIVGGRFSTAGGVGASRIAKWNGSVFQELGSGVSGGDSDLQVMAMTSFNGNLIVGGYFNAAGGLPSPNIAGWNGEVWQPLGSGMSSLVMGLSTSSERLIAVGQFTMAGGISANRVASWDGTAWQPLGAGVNALARCAISYRGDLLIGGAFTQAGTASPACCLASWKPSCPRGDLNCDGVVDLDDLTPFVSALLDSSSLGECEKSVCDMNGDFLVNGIDISLWVLRIIAP